MPSKEELKRLQALPLVEKIKVSKKVIQDWHEANKGAVYVAFSGGKDSTVCLDLVRSLFPEVPGVFVDTGLEYPEVKEFVKTKENITWVRPKMSFKEVLEKTGYPVISKEVALKVRQARENAPGSSLWNLRINGIKQNGEFTPFGQIPARWLPLLKAPFNISELCCNYLKKRPFHIYEKETMRRGITGVMAGDSRTRRTSFLKHGFGNICHAHPCAPLSHWLEKDIWEYLGAQGLEYSKVYDLPGVDRTGCVFCMFGIMRDQDRFLNLEKTHPRLHRYSMEVLGLREVLEFLRLEWTNKNQSSLLDWVPVSADPEETKAPRGGA